jgi:hypothetical protein
VKCTLNGFESLSDGPASLANPGPRTVDCLECNYGCYTHFRQIKRATSAQMQIPYVLNRDHIERYLGFAKFAFQKQFKSQAGLHSKLNLEVLRTKLTCRFWEACWAC